MTTKQILNPSLTRAMPCPSWCTTDHSDMPAGAEFHASDAIGPEAAATRKAPARLWQTDQEASPAGVVFAGQLLNEDEAHWWVSP